MWTELQPDVGRQRKIPIELVDLRAIAVLRAAVKWRQLLSSGSFRSL